MTRQFDNAVTEAYKELFAELTELEQQIEAVEARIAWYQQAPFAEAEVKPAPEAEAPKVEAKPTPEAPEAEAPKVEAKPTPEAPEAEAPEAEATNNGPGAPMGALWDAVVDCLNAADGPQRARDIVAALCESGSCEEDEGAKVRIYNSLARWGREGKLPRAGRGLYAAPPPTN